MLSYVKVIYVNNDHFSCSGTMHYALFTMHYALCTMHYALCIIDYTLCTMHYAFIRIHTYLLFYTYSYVFTISHGNPTKSRDFGTHA